MLMIALVQIGIAATELDIQVTRCSLPRAIEIGKCCDQTVSVKGCSHLPHDIWPLRSVHPGQQLISDPLQTIAATFE